MLSVIGILVVAILVVCIVFCCLCEDDYSVTGWALGIFLSGLVAVGLIITLIVGATKLATQGKIDEQIAMLTEENVNIETKVTNTVEKYLEHEFNIFDSLQGEDIQTLLVVYPEINSNELVKQEMQVFIENNTKIKELKAQKINLRTWKFLIYFG